MATETIPRYHPSPAQRAALTPAEKLHHARLQHAYDMGADYARHGANTINCHYALFASGEMTAAWERGKADAQAAARAAALRQANGRNRPA